MRIGILGLGRIGALHAQTLSGLGAVDSLVVSDPVTAAAASAAERFGATVAGSPESLLAEAGDVDTASSLLTLDDGTIAVVSNSRHNARGHWKRPAGRDPRRKAGQLTDLCDRQSAAPLLWRSLARLDLIDEYVVTLVPYLAGDGPRLFEDAGKSRQLDLQSSTAFSSALQLKYRRHR